MVVGYFAKYLRKLTCLFISKQTNKNKTREVYIRSAVSGQVLFIPGVIKLMVPI